MIHQNVYSDITPDEHHRKALLSGLIQVMARVVRHKPLPAPMLTQIYVV